MASFTTSDRSAEDDYRTGLWALVDDFVKIASIDGRFYEKDGLVQVTRMPPYAQQYENINILKLARTIQDIGLAMGILDVLEARGEDVGQRASDLLDKLRKAFRDSGMSQTAIDLSFPQPGAPHVGILSKHLASSSLKVDQLRDPINKSGLAAASPAKAPGAVAADKISRKPASSGAAILDQIRSRYPKIAWDENIVEPDGMRRFSAKPNDDGRYPRNSKYYWENNPDFTEKYYRVLDLIEGIRQSVETSGNISDGEISVIKAAEIHWRLNENVFTEAEGVFPSADIDQVMELFEVNDLESLLDVLELRFLYALHEKGADEPINWRSILRAVFTFQSPGSQFVSLKRRIRQIERKISVSRKASSSSASTGEAATKKNVSSSALTPGGIDLTRGKMPLEIRGPKGQIAVPFQFDPAQIKNFKFDGLVPVIINITPEVNLPLFLSENSSPSPGPMASKIN